jgi:hypothetical protein
MALYDILRSADYPTEDVAYRVANELERLFRLHQFEFRPDVEACIDDSGDWLVGTIESRGFGVCINLYIHGDVTHMKARVETDLDQWWEEGLMSFEGLAEIIVDAVEHDEQTQRTLTN